MDDLAAKLKALKVEMGAPVADEDASGHYINGRPVSKELFDRASRAARVTRKPQSFVVRFTLDDEHGEATDG